MQELSSPDWQAPLWIAAVCLRMLADQPEGDSLATRGETRVLMGFFTAAASAIPDAEGHSVLLDLALQVWSAMHHSMRACGAS